MIALVAGGVSAQVDSTSRPVVEPSFPALRRAVEEAASGGDARIHAFHLSQLGRAQFTAREFEGAAASFSACLRLLETDERTQRFETAEVRMLYSITAYKCGYVVEMVEAARAAIADADAGYGPNDVRAAVVRLNVVAPLLRRGHFAEVEKEILRSLDATGLKPGQIVDALNSLVEVRLVEGRIAEAATALDAIARELPKTDPRNGRLRARAHALFGQYETEQGRHVEARRHFEAQIEESSGPDAFPADAGTARACLARLDLTAGAFETAEREFAEALKSFEKNDSRRADILVDFARVALGRGDARAAEDRAAEALRVSSINLVQSARALHVRGVAAHMMGRPKDAWTTFDEAFRSIETIEGDSVARGTRAVLLRSLARASTALGRTNEAGDFAARALMEARATLESASEATSESERLAAASVARRAFDDRLSAHAGIAAGKPVPAGDVADDVLYWKGRVRRMLQIERRLIRSSDDPASAADRARLAAVEEKIAAATAAADRSSLAYLRVDPALAAERDAIERRLARTVGTSRPAPPSATEISAALGDDEALIDYVAFDRSDPADPHPRPGVDEHMAAIVYRKGVAPTFVPLGPHDGLRAATDAHRRIAARFTAADAAAAPIARAVGVAARDAVWSPIAAHLRGTTRVVISPDGCLSTFPFETLPSADPDRALIEDFETTYVAAGGDRVAREAATSSPTGALLVGAVAFGAGGASAFPPLPRSKDEIDAVEAACLAAGFCDPTRPATRLTGADATKDRFKREVAGKRIVHVASHGVYRDRAAAFDAASSRVAFTPVSSTNTSLSAQAAAVAFAGAGAAGETDGFGLLTASEATWLDLSKCDLFVLSSCDSGLGVARAGESLLGLRRAVSIAGARATITALWKAEDAAAAELFTDFYRRVAAGASVSAAFRAARLEALARTRGPGAPFGHVADWGAFVLEQARPPGANDGR